MNFSDFSIIVKSLAYNEKKFDDESRLLILLNSTKFIPDSYKEVRNAIKYSVDKWTHAILVVALRSRDLEVRKESKTNPRKESISVRGRVKKREKFSNQEGKGKSKGRSKSKDKNNKKYYNCEKLGHFKKDYFELKKKQKEKNYWELNNNTI